MEFFEVKLDTFWRPVTNVNGELLENAYVETDMQHERFRKKVNNLDAIEESKFYQFLPESISDIVRVQNKERIRQLREGAEVGNLNKPEFIDRNNAIAMDKFTNKGEA